MQWSIWKFHCLKINTTYVDSHSHKSTQISATSSSSPKSKPTSNSITSASFSASTSGESSPTNTISSLSSSVQSRSTSDSLATFITSSITSGHSSHASATPNTHSLLTANITQPPVRSASISRPGQSSYDTAAFFTLPDTWLGKNYTPTANITRTHAPTNISSITPSSNAHLSTTSVEVSTLTKSLSTRSIPTSEKGGVRVAISPVTQVPRDMPSQTSIISESEPTALPVSKEVIARKVAKPASPVPSSLCTPSTNSTNCTFVAVHTIPDWHFGLFSSSYADLAMGLQMVTHKASKKTVFIVNGAGGSWNIDAGKVEHGVAVPAELHFQPRNKPVENVTCELAKEHDGDSVCYHSFYCASSGEERRDMPSKTLTIGDSEEEPPTSTQRLHELAARSTASPALVPGPSSYCEKKNDKNHCSSFVVIEKDQHYTHYLYNDTYGLIGTSNSTSIDGVPGTYDLVKVSENGGPWGYGWMFNGTQYDIDCHGEKEAGTGVVCHLGYQCRKDD